jgi:hypothetical protein
MRAYLVVIFIIVVMMGSYIAALPLIGPSDSGRSMAGAGPF